DFFALAAVAVRPRLAGDAVARPDDVAAPATDLAPDAACRAVVAAPDPARLAVFDTVFVACVLAALTPLARFRAIDVPVGVDVGFFIPSNRANSSCVADTVPWAIPLMLSPT